MSAQASGATPYRAVWRWHLVAGLLVMPVLLLLAITGALYLYHHEIERVWYAPAMNVLPADRMLALDRQEAAVLASHPGARVVSLEWPQDAAHASTWRIDTARGDRLDVLLDPYRGLVTGTVDADTRLMRVVRSLHGELLLGRPGQWLVELVACWTLVLAATGAYLWWPRRWKWRGVVVPRLNLHGRRFWRDLHAIPAVVNLVFVVFLVLSGLPWSGFWGEQLARLGTLNEATVPTPNFHAPPSRDDLQPAGAHRHDAADAGLPWSVRHADVPTGQGDSSARIGLDRVAGVAAEAGVLRAGLRIVYPRGERGVFTLSFVPAQAQGQRTLYVDPASSSVLRDVAWRDYSPLGKTVEWGVMAHMGQQFGEANRWLALAVCVLIASTIVTGAVMWWRRRPAGSIGMPDAAGQDLPRGLAAVMIAMGVLFPLAGASMLAVWLVQRARVALRERGPRAAPPG